MRRLTVGLAGGGALLVIYLVAWPVPVDPVAWDAPPHPGHSGPFAADSLLSGLERLSIGATTGPEGVARDRAGRIYASTREGIIVRLSADGSAPEEWARTGGRPLGLAFDTAGTLFVADGVRGLLALDSLGNVRVLADSVEGTVISFADDLDVAADGRVYLSDASTKFGMAARATEDASVLDILEHGGHGRLIEYDPATRTATVLHRGLQFANGVALSHDERSVLVTETGSYRVVRIWRDGPRRGELEPVIEALPGFPDNITRGGDGRYWVALFAPRNALLDRLSRWPAIRRMLLRIPAALRPKASEYGHIIAIDDAGRVRDDRHDPTGAYPKMTSVLETATHLYIGSLEAPVLARVPLGNPPMTSYDANYYADLTQGSVRSARAVLPIVFRVLAPSSVVDIGCGQGAWLFVAGELGASALTGLDGAWVDRAALLSPAIDFRETDLARPFTLDRRFDLCISVEVAEHLPGASAEGFVAALCAAADVVLFGAAVPRQGGTDHVNEERASRWIARFEARGYDCFDLVRGAVWDREEVEWWYRQNTFVFVARGTAAHQRFTAAPPPAPPRDLVHPDAFESKLAWSESELATYRTWIEHPSLAQAARAVWRALTAPFRAVASSRPKR